jgi:DNA-binding NarL/FixJ family response regulator
MDPTLEELTPRQRQILVTYAQCWSRKETAYRLGVSEAIVRRHLLAIHRRFGLSTMGEVYLAMGWLTVPGPCQMATYPGEDPAA